MNRFLQASAATATVAIALTAFTAGDLALGRIAPAAAQAAPGGAQGGQGGQNYAKGRQQFAQMLMSLNLSDNQKTQIRSIMSNARAKSKTLTDPQAKRDTMRGAFKDIEAVLTPAQKSKLDAERAAFFKAHGGPPGGGNPGGGNPGGGNPGGS
jgi:Spy/CpxP family protein refolding chaperone